MAVGHSQRIPNICNIYAMQGANIFVNETAESQDDKTVLTIKALIKIYI